MRTSWRAVITYPPTWIAIAVVLALVVLTIALLEPSLPVAAGVVAVGAIAIVAWPAGLAATGTLRRLQDRGPAWSAAGEGDVSKLRDELDRLEDPRPAYQLQAIGEKRDNLVAMLDSRLDAGELTYGRYRSVAQQVYLAVISNLREVAIARRSISAIDTEYIDARLADLTSGDGPRNEAEILSLQLRASASSRPNCVAGAAASPSSPASSSAGVARATHRSWERSI